MPRGLVGRSTSASNRVSISVIIELFQKSLIWYFNATALARRNSRASESRRPSFRSPSICSSVHGRLTDSFGANSPLCNISISLDSVKSSLTEKFSLSIFSYSLSMIRVSRNLVARKSSHEAVGHGRHNTRDPTTLAEFWRTSRTTLV